MIVVAETIYGFIREWPLLRVATKRGTTVYCFGVCAVAGKASQGDPPGSNWVVGDLRGKGGGGTDLTSISQNVQTFLLLCPMQARVLCRDVFTFLANKFDMGPI